MSFLILLASANPGLPTTVLTGNLVVGFINYQGDTLIKLTNLTNVITNALVNSATVNAQVFDAFNNLQFSTALLNYDNSGDYEATMPAISTGTLTLGGTVFVKCRATTSDGAVFVDEQMHLVEYVST